MILWLTWPPLISRCKSTNKIRTYKYPSTFSKKIHNKNTKHHQPENSLSPEMHPHVFHISSDYYYFCCCIFRLSPCLPSDFTPCTHLFIDNMMPFFPVPYLQCWQPDDSLSRTLFGKTCLIDPVTSDIGCQSVSQCDKRIGVVEKQLHTSWKIMTSNIMRRQPGSLLEPWQPANWYNYSFRTLSFGKQGQGN